MWFIKCRTAQAAVGLAVEAPGFSRPLQSWVCTGLGRGVSRYVCEDLRPTLSLSPTKEPATSGRSALLIQVAREATLAQAWTPKWGVTQAGTEPLSWILWLSSGMLSRDADAGCSPHRDADVYRGGEAVALTSEGSPEPVMDTPPPDFAC